MRTRPVMPDRDLPFLEELFRVVTECDGHRPIGEHKYLDLLQPDRDHPIGLVGEEAPGHGPVAYVALSPGRDDATWTMEMALHPLHRSPQDVETLIEAAVSQVRDAGGAGVRMWAFQPNLVGSLEAAGFVPERELRQLRRPLPVDPRPRFPQSVEIRPFRPGSDEAAWLEVNNAAFAGHPENGSWTIDVLRDREAQPWFDSGGFRMAWEGSDLVGFCWNKIHGDEAVWEGEARVGEIYVIAVAPQAQGRSLGENLVLEGLRHMREERGASVAMLYVDAGNVIARRLYDKLGFRLDHVDRSLVKRL